jgi:response regulator of citrate/malate metabolism
MARPKGLNNKTVARIRDNYNKGRFTQQELADKFKVSQSTICKIVNNYIHKSDDSDFIMGGAAKVKLVIEYGD